MMKKSLLLACAQLILAWPLSAAETPEDGQPTATNADALQSLEAKQITAELKLEKDTIMLDEPMHFAFIVKNASDIPLRVEEGGCHGNAFGRPENFKVTVRDGQGNLVPQLKSTMMTGGVVGFEPLAAHGGQKASWLLLTHWANFEHPGSYSVCVEHDAVLRRDKDFEKPWEAPTRKIHVSATAELLVIPSDSVRMGQMIDALGVEIVAQPDGVESDTVNRAIEKLGAFQDERTIPWFLKMLHKRDWGMKYQAMKSLEKHNTIVAFEALKECFYATSADGDDPEDIAGTAAWSLYNSAYPGAVAFLLTQAQNPNYRIRCAVVQVLGRKVPPEKSTSMLEEMAADENEYVRNSAAFYLNRIKEGKPVFVANP